VVRCAGSHAKLGACEEKVFEVGGPWKKTIELASLARLVRGSLCKRGPLSRTDRCANPLEFGTLHILSIPLPYTS
jgi:hypothetical protein